mgnify:FL=1
MRDARITKKASFNALHNAVLGKPTEDTTTSPTTPNSSVGHSSPLKSSKGTDVNNNWLELYSEREEPVTLKEIIRGRPGGPKGKRYPIVRCFNTKDMTDDANFEPCILVKVRNDQFEVMDVNDDAKLEDDLSWKGDDGLENNWGMYYKYPSEEFVESYRRDLEMVEDTEDTDYLNHWTL